MADVDNDGYLLGQPLVAMPSMRDPRFTRSVIFVCAHNAEGAMGLVVNRLVGSLTFPDLLAQLGFWLRSGKVIALETVVNGFENAPRSLAGLFRGDNLGKMLLNVAD